MQEIYYLGVYMGFMEHLQSSLILGTQLDPPQSSLFDIERINLFFHCLENNDHQSVENMIVEGFCVDTPHYKTHITPLMFAVDLHFESLALLLVGYGANIYLEDLQKNSILFLSLQNKLLALSELLLSHGAFKLQSMPMKKKTFTLISDHNKEPLQNYEELLSKTPSRENIFNIVQQGDIHNLLFFLHQKPKIELTNSKQQSLLHLAVMSASKAMVCLLLNRGLNIDSKDKYGNFPLIYATHHPHRIEVLKLLIARGATLDQVNYGEHTALTMAIRKHNFLAIEELINAGANINLRDGIHTALSLVHDQLNTGIDTKSKDKFRKILLTLYTHGAHVDAIGDTIGWTPLQLSMNFQDNQFYINHATKLISLGAQLNIQDKVGRTPIMIAAVLGRAESTKLLAQKGADLNIIDKHGWSALMLAVYNNHYNIVQSLLFYNADVNLITKGKLSALKIAIDQKNRRIEHVLRDHGASIEEF